MVALRTYKYNSISSPANLNYHLFFFISKIFKTIEIRKLITHGAYLRRWWPEQMTSRSRSWRWAGWSIRWRRPRRAGSPPPPLAVWCSRQQPPPPPPPSFSFSSSCSRSIVRVQTLWSAGRPGPPLESSLARSFYLSAPYIYIYMIDERSSTHSSVFALLRSSSAREQE